MEHFDNHQLFDQNGCLTAQGLAALAQGRLDELGRLEAAEHLAYCNRCLKQYTNLLAASPLAQPPKDLAGPVRRSITARLMHTTWGRAAVAAAAVVLAFGMWQAGVFAPPDLLSRQAALPIAARQEPTGPNAFDKAGQGLNNTFLTFREELNLLFTAPRTIQQEDISYES
ncbi:MAG: hypothetical protein IIV90_03465 [Oscillospiraceae bacterium]|nr:hypothetical protein [Oscillospiraceae bacterium]